jgi:hypothetical protein
MADAVVGKYGEIAFLYHVKHVFPEKGFELGCSEKMSTPSKIMVLLSLCPWGGRRRGGDASGSQSGQKGRGWVWEPGDVRGGVFGLLQVADKRVPAQGGC